MKKIVFALFFLILTTFFCGCQATETTVPTAAITTPSSTQSIEPPQNGETYYFDSYDQLQAAILGDRNQSFQNTVAQEAPKLTPLLSCLAQQNTIPNPTYNKKPMDSKYTQVILFENELFNAPMIMYHCEYQGIHVRIRLSYLSLFNTEAEAKMDIVRFIKAVDPEFPNPNNFEQFDYINTLMDKKINIGTSSILARVIKANEGWYDKIHFLYNGFYVQIEAPDLLEFDADFFAGFSIE